MTPLDILIIEDDADARDNLRDILELDDHRVATAGSARCAIELGDWTRFAAVILDRRLPDSTAEQLLPTLRARAPAASVIVVTGYADLEGAIAALRQGAADYILKPINADMLRASLGRIAERLRLALEKERTESAFRHLVEAAECLIVILRSDRSIDYFSPFAERLCGYRDHEIRGRDLISLFSSDGVEDAARFFERAAREPVQGFQTRIIGKDGGGRWIAWNARPLPDHEGAPAVMLVGHDFSFLKGAQERLVQSERLAAIGEVVTGLAHESRNALQRSQACLEMLTLTVRDRPAALDLIDRLQNAQDHLHHLYEDVRQYAAPIKLEPARCDAREVWRESWAHLEKARGEKKAVLTEKCAGVDLRVVADRFRLGQVFHNVLENALAASPVPALVEIAATPAAIQGAPALLIAVHDNGPGVPSELRDRIFEPFHTSKAKGTGLGLAIARRVVEAHGGCVEAAADQRPGALFLITLPKGPP